MYCENYYPVEMEVVIVTVECTGFLHFYKKIVNLICIEFRSTNSSKRLLNL
jgi:hypothetical protein